MRVVVIGAGVVGMTCAIHLQETGVDVTIIAKDAPLQTNSDAAVAAWYAPSNHKLALQTLCIDSLPTLFELGLDDASGVTLIPIQYCFADEAEFLSSAFVNDVCRERLKISRADNNQFLSDQKNPFVINAEIPLMDVNFYRPFLLKRFLKNGGSIIQKEVHAMTDLADQFDVIVNCTGWEAKKLTEDREINPARGQLEVIHLGEKFSPQTSINIMSSGMYVIFRPLSKDVVVGATHDLFSSDRHNSADDRALLVDAMKSFLPDISNEQITSKVGIRAAREVVRIEVEKIHLSANRTVTVIHNYGHGGSGFSAAWGSAFRVLKLLRE